MAITIEQQLGPYEITSLLGKGGLERCIAHVTLNLKRDVAIKILLDSLILGNGAARVLLRPVESDSNAAVAVICSFGADRLRGVPGKIIKRTP